MELISNMLFWLSNGMLIPDIIFLLFFFIKALLMIGGFYGTYIARTKINVKLKPRNRKDRGGGVPRHAARGQRAKANCWSTSAR